MLVSQYHKTRISAVVSLRRKFLKKTPWKVLSVIAKSLWNIRFALKSHGFSLETFPVEGTGIGAREGDGRSEASVRGSAF